MFCFLRAIVTAGECWKLLVSALRWFTSPVMDKGIPTTICSFVLLLFLFVLHTSIVFTAIDLVVLSMIITVNCKHV